MKKVKKKKANSTVSIFSYLAYLLLLGLGAFLFGIFMNTEGSGSGEFAHYSGPVLPITSLNGAEGVEVERNVNFDFSPCQTPNAFHHAGKGAAEITDTYVLTNTTGERKTLELVYGFLGSFTDDPREFPTIEVDGAAIQPELFPSIDPEENLYYSGSFDNYSSLMEETGYLSIATQRPEPMDIPVTAYHFTDLSYNGTESALDPMLTIRCALNDNSLVWATGLTKSETEQDGRELMMFSVNQGEAWLFTMGGTLIAPEFGGNDGFFVEKDSDLDGITFHMETYETTLMDAILVSAGKYMTHDPDIHADWITPELLAEYAGRRIQEMGLQEASGILRFDTLFYSEFHEIRMMYLLFPAELEPGESIIVEASYMQEPSWDGNGPKPYREGYDLATRLGSDLDFTGLAASLSGTDFIELGEQNFGFDLEKGILEVNLDLQTERYYMEVKFKK